MTDDAETLACLALAEFYNEQPTMDKITTFSEYSESCLATQMDSCKNTSYLCFGLGSELGELQGIFQKSIRGDFTLEQKREDVGKETGDAFWNLDRLSMQELGCGLANLLKIDSVDTFQSHFGICDIDKYRIIVDAMDRANRLIVWLMNYHDNLSPKEIADGITGVSIKLAKLATSFDLKLSDILTVNRDKRYDRLARGVIKGNGDNR